MARTFLVGNVQRVSYWCQDHHEDFDMVAKGKNPDVIWIYSKERARGFLLEQRDTIVPLYSGDGSVREIVSMLLTRRRR